ncbi:bactericidal permeability-increasing protein [Engraulis encrasicolus]|uniref:bactericidal permeability-increasing protein n=1 Tax=Engraulis encrasicolus TaxID=184585 RepID=UPI002FD1F7C2
MRSLLILLLMVLLLAPESFAAHPGVKVAFTSKGLDYVKNVVADRVQEKLLTAILPPVEGSVSIGIGNVHYALTQMKVVKVDLPQPSVSFVQDVGVSVEVSGLSIAISGNWRTRFGIIKDRGTFEMALFGLSSSLTVQLGNDSQGRVSVDCLSCSASLDRVDVRFHGGAGAIIEAFVELFPGLIKGRIEGRICPLLEKQVGDLEVLMAAMKVRIPVDKGMVFDISLMNAPLVSTSNMEMDLKGVFYSQQHPKEPPFAAQDFQLPPRPGSMISVGISQFTYNTLGYAYLSAGLLQKNITDDMIPKVSPVRLNTSSFGAFVPQLPKLFPNMLMELQVFAEEAPAVCFQMDSFSVAMSTTINAYALNCSQLLPLFTLKLTTKFNGKLSIADNKLVGVLEFNNLTLSLVSSKIGTFKTLSLETVMAQGVKTFLLPTLNAKLMAGFPLPVKKGVELVQPVLQIQQGFLAVFSDIKMTQYFESERML